ncbi:MAG: C-terminal binding protein [Planctomycetaceae bacterium]|nr:MAG: C-terminal binding protein [Planctomycetaceae bacterium]
MASKIKVVITDYIEPDMAWETAEFAKRGVDFKYYQLKSASEAEVSAATADADIVVVNMVKITPSLIDTWKNVKLVIRHGTGYDNVDVPALTAKGIILEYIPDYCLHEVAEQAIALMFACARKVVWSRKIVDDSVKRGEWDFREIIPMFRMDGATVGLIGCGRIGSLVYKKLQHFGVKFLICDPYLSEKRRAALGIELHSLEHVMSNSDFITVHTPLNNETRYIINAKTLAYMKPTAYIVNTSRGGMVNVDDLAEVLKARKIAGAAIDVFEKEPPRADYPLLGLDNAIVTPHLSWYSEDAGQTIREKIMQDVDMFIDGTGPRCPVNPEAKKA